MSEAQKKAEELMQRRGGGEPMPYHRVLAELDADLFDAYEKWYSSLLLPTRDEALDPGVLELIIIGACASVKEHKGIAIHAHKAVNQLGVPRRQVYEAVLVAGILGGMPALRDALAILDQEIPLES